MHSKKNMIMGILFFSMGKVSAKEQEALRRVNKIRKLN